MGGRWLGATRRAFLAAALVLPILVPAQAATGAPDPGKRKAYIVLFDSSVGDPEGKAKAQADRFGGTVDRVYRGQIAGYVGRFRGDQRAALGAEKGVRVVAEDGPVRIATTQTSAPAHLDRVDQLLRPLNGEYRYTATGQGVTAYVIDTGIRTTHTQFASADGTSRAAIGFDAFSGGTGQDCNGHGTHVAGILGGSTYGAAKAVSLVGVRVLDCGGSGSWSGVIAGINWVTNNAKKPAVANMSLGGGRNDAVDAALRTSIASGITYAVAAGNSRADACRYSPSRVTQALTIGATSAGSDSRASYSNWGSCLDFFAPGSSVQSAYHSSDTTTAIMSGTSMASPLAAGVAALYLQGHTGASPATVGSALSALTSKHVVTSSKTTNNNLLFTNF